MGTNADLRPNPARSSRIAPITVQTEVRVCAAEGKGQVSGAKGGSARTTRFAGTPRQVPHARSVIRTLVPITPASSNTETPAVPAAVRQAHPPDGNLSAAVCTCCLVGGRIVRGREYATKEESLEAVGL